MEAEEMVGGNSPRMHSCVKEVLGLKTAWPPLSSASGESTLGMLRGTLPDSLVLTLKAPGRSSYLETLLLWMVSVKAGHGDEWAYFFLLEKSS